MAIVALKKLTFCGLSPVKLQILEALQQLGCAHLIALKKPSPDSEPAYSKDAENALKALKYLSQCLNKRHQLSDDNEFDFGEVVDRALAIQLKSRLLADKRDALQKRVKEIEPWGDFSLPMNGSLQDQKLWFYIVPERMMPRMQAVDLVWEVVHKDNLYHYVVVINSQEPPLSSLPVARTHIGKVPLSKLQIELNHVQVELEDLQAERESLTRWIGMIAANLAAVEDRSELIHADSISIDSDGVFIIQAWIPEDRLAECEQFANQHQLALICADPGADEAPPTLLKNPDYLAGGADLVYFYHPPDYFGWDPSAVVFFSFALFFAMILSDAGYAGLFALLLGLNWPKLGRSEKGRRLRMLAMTTVAFSLLWGMLAGSYFGYAPAPGSVLNEWKLVDINDFDAMLRLSVFVGVAHIAIANAVMCYHFRRKTIALAFLGWLMISIGGFLLWYAASINAVFLQQSSYGLLIAGGLLLLFFSSERAIEKPVDWLWRILEGCRSLTRLTGLFGDVLSYMRLFALGLASATLALVFNRLAAQVYHSAGDAGIVLSILILLLGHALNLALCLLSGVVHGMRLNFIEFYHWSISDEGYPFKAFSKKGVD